MLLGVYHLLFQRLCQVMRTASQVPQRSMCHYACEETHGTHGPRLLEGLAIQKTKEENHRSSKRDPVDSSIAEMRSCFTCLEGTPFVFPKQFTQKWFLTKLGPNESF